jgi:hypothetical protein
MNVHDFTAVARLNFLNIYCEACAKTQFLSAVAKIAKNDSFVMPVRPSAWNNSAAIERIFMKFDIWGFLENMS